VLLRYALGDITVLSRERCPHCGSWTDRLTAMPRRADALLKIKGTLVNPDVLTQAAEAAVGAREFQFVVEHDGVGDRLTLKLAEGGAIPGVAEAVKRACGVTPAVEYVSAAALAGSSWKLKRVVDLRRG
jgi:phenylacetate-coenzyme A ligase PaaK-like adenylate-forming protein